MSHRLALVATGRTALSRHHRVAAVDMTPHPLHVCFVCNELPPASAGGIGPCVLTNAQHLAQLGHKVTVVGIYEQRHHWDETAITVHPVILRRLRSSLGAKAVHIIRERLQIRQALMQIHHQHPIDVVEWPDFEGLYFRRIDGIVDVVRNHGPLLSHRLLGLAERRRHIEWLECRMLKTVENWIGVSKWFMNEWLQITGAKPRRTIVLYNPVDCDVFRPSTRSGNNNVILYAGSLMERKGAFALARAARLFLPRLPDAELLFVGRDLSGHARQHIIELAGEIAAKQIRFADPLPQAHLAELMRQSAIFAMPSLLESFGNVWAEAMASGVPVLGSKLTCGPEIVPNEEAGLLVNPHEPGEIADRVVRLMHDPSLRRQLGETGRAIALARYSTRSLIPRTVEFYRQCLSAPSPS